MTPPHAVDDARLDDLRARLRAWRPVDGPTGGGWDRGVDGAYLRGLVTDWADRYDWRVHEERVRSLPWVETAGLRLIHAKAASDAGDVPVVLLHGWPDSVLRYSRVLPLLADVDVVVPALPGYPFSLPWPTGGASAGEMASAVAAAMVELGYNRYVVSGGDVGSAVAVQMAVSSPSSVAALHLTDVRLRRPSEGGEQGAEELEFLERGRRWQRREGAYLLEQATKPHTLMVGLGDSPAGLLAWIVEKLRDWSACDGDVESVFARDDLLTWVTSYWVTGCIGTSFGPYTRPSPPLTGRVEVPTVVTQFPGELVRAPRAAAERAYDLREWQEPSGGGHFGAWERPDDFVAGVRAALRLVAQ